MAKMSLVKKQDDYLYNLAEKCVDIAFQSSQRLLAERQSFCELQLHKGFNARQVFPTDCDIWIEELLSCELSQLHAVPIISEESYKRNCEPTYLECDEYWLIDPIDASHNFYASTGSYSINIALIRQGIPVIGVIALPLEKSVYRSSANSCAFMQTDGGDEKIIKTCVHSKSLRITTNRFFDDNVFRAAISSFDSVGIKFLGGGKKLCSVASGGADCCFRFAASRGWDTAAGHCILEGAGGVIADLQGRPIKYSSRNRFHNPFLVAASSLELLHHILDSIRGFNAFEGRI